MSLSRSHCAPQRLNVLFFVVLNPHSDLKSCTLLRSSHFLGVSLASINSVYSCNVPYFIKTNKYNVFIIYLIVIKFRILVCKERLVQSARIARREREVKIISTS